MRNTILIIGALSFALIPSAFAGEIVAWGDNSEGQCNIPTGNDFIKISSSDRHNLALRSDGSIIGWGETSSRRTHWTCRTSTCSSIV